MYLLVLYSACALNKKGKSGIHHYNYTIKYAKLVQRIFDQCEFNFEIARK